MIDARTVRFIGLLLKRTKQRKLNWEETADENIYQATLGEHTIQVVHSEGYDDQHDAAFDIYHVQLVSLSGRVIDEYRSFALAKAGLTDASAVLRELWESARSQALGVDVALEDILSKLGDDGGSDGALDEEEIPF